MTEYKPTEYIVDFGDCKSSAFVGLAIADAEQHGAKLEEKIVRCKDCDYYYEADNYHPSGNYTSRCCKYFDSYMNEVQPDGFCAWGTKVERKRS